MADLTPEEAARLGIPSTAQGVNGMVDAAQKDPLAVWWAMLTGQDSATSGGFGNMVSHQGGGFNPANSPNEASALASSFQLQRDIQNAPELDAIFRAGANAGPRANPYSTVVADQSRPAQLALIQQMRGQLNGPSLAAMQGQRALGQSGQQALMNSALGGGRAAMLQSANVGSGLAGDVGQARLGEVMRSQAGMGGAAGNLRGADLRSADAQMQAALQQRQQDDALRRFYASQGAALQNARDQAGANRQITYYQQLAKNNQRDAQNVGNFAQSSATLASKAAGI